MKYFNALLVFVFKLIVLVSPCLAVQDPDVSLLIKVLEDQDGHPRRINGEIAISNWSSTAQKCFYLPFNDNDRHDFKTPASHFDNVTSVQGRQRIDSGSQIIVTSPWPKQKIEKLAPHLISIPPSAIGSIGSTIRLNFEATLPRLPNHEGYHWFFDGFYPKPLSRCPDGGVSSHYFSQINHAHFSAKIQYPQGWQLVTPGKLNEHLRSEFKEVSLSGHKFAFALSRHLRVHKSIVDQVEVEFYFQSENANKLIPTIEHALKSHRQWLGPFPFDRLVIIETSEVEEAGIPGLIAFNRPRQELFRVLQDDLINWQQWMMTSMISNQWIEAGMRSSSIDDRWFFSGLSEFLTLISLQKQGQHYDLFNMRKDGLISASFNYQQIQNISAAVLRKNVPFSPLTNSQLESEQPIKLQHPLMFVKHAIALKYLKSAIGEAPFADFLQSFIKKYQFKETSPKLFWQHFISEDTKLTPAQGAEYQEYLRQWWTSGGWPDFAIQTFEKRQLSDKQWQAKIVVNQEGEISLPISSVVIDELGKQHFVRSYPKDGDSKEYFESSVLTEARPEKLIIDPNYDVFDSNRFNNTSTLPNIDFFPGSTLKLSDSDYTVIWLPYVFRRPAEPLSLAIQAAIFRYVQSGLFIGLEAAPWEDLYAFRIVKKYAISKHALNIQGNISQEYDNSRAISLGVSRDPIVRMNPRLALDLSVNHRETVGIESSQHHTITMGLGIAPKTDVCDGRLYGKTEHAPKGIGSDFSYFRNTAVLNFGCDILGASRVQTQTFAGRIVSPDELPETTFFKPNNVSEAGMRLDVKDLKGGRSIIAMTNDVILPFILPIPGNTLVLNRNIKIDLFYDYGLTEKDGLLQRFSDYGFGFLVPFGGDVVGAGPLAITKLSLFAVLFTDADGQTSHQPRFLLSLSGAI